jgi:hypothetical protein
MWNVDRQTTDENDGNSSHGLKARWAKNEEMFIGKRRPLTERRILHIRISNFKRKNT